MIDRARDSRGLIAHSAHRTIRSMLSENSTPKTQARAFSWFAFTSNCGIFVGPLIGRRCLKVPVGYGTNRW